MQKGRNAQRRLDVLPGAWLDTNEHLMTLSPIGGFSSPSDDRRSLHHHFALSTSLRPSFQKPVSDTLTCLMEGMGVRYRPSVSMGHVVNESLHTLTSGGYGAGSYWKRLYPSHPSVLAVLANSSRSYSWLHETATNMKESLSPKFRGYHSRDVISGVLPEAEDCREALEYCFDVRDVYHPPEGSGLGVDEEGAYFDDGL
eukprot:CAMPEP_0116835484 /NCGR_PEP_ID=MMETSP0418-20121206/7572_1 /TAXON_ID=1158023 /ORGANISM="Astrosyne radiata, Strain 13vi08-1A" /LENGTH=198 /DNA_ID=CAMNT_0004465159 /DNA_START=15 /DNA_END=611 /DNA_ORIENTATION=+